MGGFAVFPLDAMPILHDKTPKKITKKPMKNSIEASLTAKSSRAKKAGGIFWEGLAL
ncbi:outer membrane domain protein [Helicobacter pylori CPY1962]|nr:outer membrane domain protein [Helicobacter pylori CPY1962]